MDIGTNIDLHRSPARSAGSRWGIKRSEFWQVIFNVFQHSAADGDRNPAGRDKGAAVMPIKLRQLLHCIIPGMSAIL